MPISEKSISSGYQRVEKGDIGAFDKYHVTYTDINEINYTIKHDNRSDVYTIQDSYQSKPSHIIICGPVKSGKSYITNKLKDNNNNNFVLNNNNQCMIRTFKSSIDNCIVCDVSGPIDSTEYQNMLHNHLYLSQNYIKAIVIVYNNNTYDDVDAYLNMFKNSGFINNIILVCNHSSSHIGITRHENFFDVIHIEDNQLDLSLLSSYIECKPVIVLHTPNLVDQNDNDIPDINNNELLEQPLPNIDEKKSYLKLVFIILTILFVLFAYFYTTTTSNNSISYNNMNTVNSTTYLNGHLDKNTESSNCTESECINPAHNSTFLLDQLYKNTEKSSEVALSRAENALTNPGIITSFGRTGSGKSFIGNLLTKPGTFIEGDTLESQTTTISSAVCWNGRDTFSDVPGYFDSEGRDQIQQANFVDYLKDKWIKAILFVFTDKVDSFIKNSLNTFKESDLKNNVILVINKDLKNRSDSTTIYDGFPVIYINAYQTNVDILKRVVDSMTPVLVKNPPEPVSLFKHPIRIKSEIEISEFLKIIEITEKETLESKKQIPNDFCRKEWKGLIGKLLGIKKTVCYTVMNDVTESNEVNVTRKYAIYNVYKLIYAERFDGNIAIYKKKFIRSDKTKV